MSNEWKTVRLGDCATFINGRAFKPSEWNNIGKPIIRIQNLTGSNSDINYYDGEVDKKYKVYNGDILISWSASLGVFVWNQGDAVLNQHIFKVEFNKLSIDKKYFYYLVKNSLDAMDLQTHGATMKHITKGKFDNIQVPYFSIEQQRKIGAVLDKASELVEKRKAQLAELDLLAESVFYDMFGDPKVNMHNFEQKEFQYCIDYMGDIGSNGANADVSRNLKMKDVTDYALMVRFVNLTANDFVNNVKYVSKETYDYFSKSKIYGGELIFCKIGSAGMNYIMPCLNKPVSLGLNQIMIKTNQMIVMSYLYRYLNTQYGEYLISTCINGAVTKSITKTALKKIPILLPPLSLQHQFAEKTEKIEEQKQNVKTALKESENLFQRLMQDMFNPEYHNS